MNPKTLPIRCNPAAFARADVLALIAVAALLTGLALPARLHARSGSAGAFCGNNLAQLTRGWTVYAADYRDTIVKTGGLDVEVDTVSPKHQYINNQWCMGNMSSLTGATNFALLEESLLFPYVRSLAAYHCPADSSHRFFQTGVGPSRVRSYSMNCWMNPWNAWDGLGVYTKIPDLSLLGPANTFLLAEEAPASINDGWFTEDRWDPAVAAPQWVDAPGAYHAGAGVLSFADGHSETRHWTDPAIVRVGTNTFWPGGNAVGPDLQWLASRGIIKH
jgi:hypothetical protein